MRARQITVEQIQKIRDETHHQGETLSRKWMQAGIASLDAQRLVGFNAVAQHEAPCASMNIFTSIASFLVRLPEPSQELKDCDSPVPLCLHIVDSLSFSLPHPLVMSYKRCHGKCIYIHGMSYNMPYNDWPQLIMCQRYSLCD